MTIETGKRIRHWRELRGLSQVELARRTGMQKYKLCRIEAGKQEARATDIESIADALGLTMPEFYGAEA